MSDPQRQARRAAGASARRLQRLERARTRGPFAGGRTVLVVLAGGVVVVVAVAAATGRLEVPTPPGGAADLARSVGAATATDDDLVVRIANRSGDDAMTDEVARLARQAGIHGHETVQGAGSAADTRLLVHRDAPEVLAAAADLRDLIGAGVVERADAVGHTADLTVVVGADARTP